MLKCQTILAPQNLLDGAARGNGAVLFQVAPEPNVTNKLTHWPILIHRPNKKRVDFPSPMEDPGHGARKAESNLDSLVL
jgi:hypothetical protein